MIENTNESLVFLVIVLTQHDADIVKQIAASTFSAVQMRCASYQLNARETQRTEDRMTTATTNATHTHFCIICGAWFDCTNRWAIGQQLMECRRETRGRCADCIERARSN